jgi:nucleotide-binding universal stress UspA family protein
VRSDVRAERARSVRETSTPGSARADAAKGPQHATPRREAVQRLLVPVDATERSRWPLRYALAHRGRPLHVDLLFVAEPVTRLEILRFRTQAEMAQWQARMAQWLLEDAANPLQEAGLSVDSHFREGDIAEEIVETAERLGADAIVMPPPHSVWLNFLTRGIVRKVLRRARTTPVVHVDREGRPLAASPTRIAAQSI